MTVIPLKSFQSISESAQDLKGGSVSLWTVVGCEKVAVLSLLKPLKKLTLINVK